MPERVAIFAMSVFSAAQSKSSHQRSTSSPVLALPPCFANHAAGIILGRCHCGVKGAPSASTKSYATASASSLSLSGLSFGQIEEKLSPPNRRGATKEADAPTVRVGGGGDLGHRDLTSASHGSESE
jgi:hypothetical protein